MPKYFQSLVQSVTTIIDFEPFDREHELPL